MTKNVFNSISHVSNRPKSILKDEDYDHEIYLLDHSTITHTSRRSVELPRGEASSSLNTARPRRHSDENGHRDSNSMVRRGTRSKVRGEMERKRWSKKWTEDRPAERAGQMITSVEGSIKGKPTSSDVRVVVTDATEEAEEVREGRPRIKPAMTPPIIKRSHSCQKLESAIDILYENQRGGILCGYRLFSSRALGAIDAAPWTNIAFKASATGISDAQVPDPSWEWAWESWVVNHDPDSTTQDEDGWEYSFMFSKYCSWHGPSWYNSCVRRRPWIRMRVRREQNLGADDDPHRLTADYFTIHSERQRSVSTRSGANSASRSGSSRRDEEGRDKEDIFDIAHLLRAMKDSRIDREKSEAVENFVANAGDDLVYLGRRMHDVMGMFIFQASRRLLLAHLSKALDAATKEEMERQQIKKEEGGEIKTDEEAQEEERKKTRLSNLRQAVAAADEEVKNLEYWSDIKDIAEAGATEGAVDERKGWNEEWKGLDGSGPTAVITEAKMPGVADGPAARYEDGKGSERQGEGNPKWKGKGRVSWEA